MRAGAGSEKKPKSAGKPGSVTALARYGRHSSRRAVAGALKPPTRGLGEQRRHPPTWCCSGWRLPRFTRRRLGLTRTCGDSSLWPCSSPSSAARAATYCGRALPGILLCGARTFLPPVSRAATVWLASDSKHSLCWAARSSRQPAAIRLRRGRVAAAARALIDDPLGGAPSPGERFALGRSGPALRAFPPRGSEFALGTARRAHRTRQCTASPARSDTTRRSPHG